MTRLRWIVGLWCWLVCAAPVVQAQSGRGGGALAEVDRLREGGQFQAALERLEVLQAETPDRAAVLWRLARTHVDLGEAADSEGTRRRHFTTAVEMAHRAVEGDPQSAPAFLARAIADGRLALISSNRRKAELARAIKESVDRAIALDPSLALAYHVRGRWYYEIADLGFIERTALKVAYGGVPDASFEQAAQDFKQAVRLEREIPHLTELGRAYLKLGEPEQARTQFKEAVALPLHGPKDERYQQIARAMLQKID